MPDIPEIIETKRLYLRPYRDGDWVWYCRMSLKNKMHLQRYEAGNPVMYINTVDDAKRTILDFTSDWEKDRSYFLGAFLRDTHEFVAQIYVGHSNRELPEFVIGYFVDVDHQGQGYVSEAVREVIKVLFEQAGAQRLRLECDDTNLASMRVAERCGMVKEGHLRENKHHPDGSFSGTCLYGILRSEYQGHG